MRSMAVYAEFKVERETRSERHASGGLSNFLHSVFLSHSLDARKVFAFLRVS